MSQSLTITIDLELTSPVSGSISSQRGQLTRFSGWLELHAVLEGLCAAAGSRAAPGARSADVHEQAAE